MKHYLYIFLALIIGVILGGGCARIHYAKLFGRQIIDFSYAKVVDDVTTLTMLRQNTTPELLHDKENELSYTLEGLQDVEDLNSISTNQNRYLKMAANYRRKYPFQTGDTNIDREVDDFLQKIEQRK